MKKLIILLFFLSIGSIFADDTKFDLLGLEIDIDSKLRSRLAYLNNFYPDDKYLMSDIKGEFEFKFDWDSDFYVNSLVELGNIDLDADTEVEDFLEFELKEAYLGYKNGFIKAKAGIIDMITPGGYVLDGEGAGTQFKFDFESFDLKTFYSTYNLIDDELEVVDSSSDINHLFYTGVSRETFYKYDLWGMYYKDNSMDDFDYFSIWLGWEGEKEFDYFDIDFGLTLNGGAIDDDGSEYALLAGYSHGKVEFHATENLSIFGRLNSMSGAGEMVDTINQFQVVDGSLDTGLSLMFGGSPYSGISYFSDDSLSIYSDNLSDGYVAMYDPGLVIYELGLTYKMDTVPYEGQFVIGGASTQNEVDDSTFIGFEVDLHNKYQVTENFSVALSIAYFISGDALEYLYYANEGELLDDDTSFKADCSFTYKF